MTFLARRRVYRGLTVLSAMMMLASTQPVLAKATPSSVRQSIYRSGVAATLRSLQIREQEETVLEGIARGDERWIRLVPMIAGDADEFFGHQITLAMAFALVSAPEAALKALEIVDTRIEKDEVAWYPYGTDAVCGMPMSLDFTRQAAEKYYAAAIDTLNTQGEQGAECHYRMEQEMNTLRVEDVQEGHDWGGADW